MVTYAATMSGSSWAVGPVAEFATIREARRWAESFGDTADLCTITTPSGRVVAEHRRDTNGDGRSWYRCIVRPDPRRWIEERDPYPIPDFPPRHRGDPVRGMAR